MVWEHVHKYTLITYGLILLIIIMLVYVFHVTGYDQRPEYFEWAILYFGSAIIQAYAAIIAVPFTIWVIYMQSRYGYILVRLFLNRVIYPFTILGVITIVTAITMSLEKTIYAYHAFMIELSVALLFLPPIIHYIRDLMTMSPENVVRTLRKASGTVEEFIAASLHVLRLVMVEAYPEEKAINNILKMIYENTRDVEKLKLYPDTYHKLRDLLKTIVYEGTYLPGIYLLKGLMKNFMIWLVRNRKERITRSFIRYYRAISLRYMEERLPSEGIEDLFIEPVIDTLKALKAKRSILGYALDQLIALLHKIKRAGTIGDITSLEMCHIINIVEKHVLGLETLKEFEKLRRLINEIRGEFLCVY